MTRPRLALVFPWYAEQPPASVADTMTSTKGEIKRVIDSASSRSHPRDDAAPEKRRDWPRKQGALSTSPFLRLAAVAVVATTLHAQPCVSAGARGEDESKPQFRVLEVLFPDLDALARSWERHPLLCTAHRGRISAAKNEEECTAVDGGSCRSRAGRRGNVPISFDWSSSSSSPDGTETEAESVLRRVGRIHSSIFAPSDVDSVLSPSSLSKLSHGRDYSVVKRVLDTDGVTERRGTLPGQDLSAGKIRQALEEGGYSVVVNYVQRKHDKIKTAADYLMKDIGPGITSANLYMTPAAERRSTGGKDESTEWETKHAFETHWDWMDVIVVQVSGTKLWSVASEPVVFLSHSDQVRKLKNTELQTYAATRFNKFLMRPGDALYIPRGFPHNASTIGTEVFNRMTSSTNANAASPASTLTSEPSIHVTFGMETYCDTTIETLLHRTLDYYAEHFPNRDSIAIAGEACGANLDQVVRWDAVLHASIAEMSRREDRPCGTDSRDGLCALRKSIALNPAWRRMLSRTGSPEEEKGDGVNVTGNDATDGLLRSYLSAVDALSESADLRRLATFVGYVQTPREGSSSHALFECLPTVLPAIHVLLCPPSAIATANRDKFSDYVQGFANYAKTKDGRRAGMKVLEERLEHKQLDRRSG